MLKIGLIDKMPGNVLVRKKRSINIVPQALNLFITGTLQVTETLTGHYTYYDADGDAEGTSIYSWYRADDAAGLNSAVIVGETNTTYTLQVADEGKYISFGVIPVATSGNTPGVLAQSDYEGAIVPDCTLVTYSDNFNAYSDVLLQDQANWDLEYGSMWVESDGINHRVHAYASQECCCYYNTVVDDDQWSQCTIVATAVNRWLGVSVRIDGGGTGDYYAYTGHTNTRYICKVVNGVKTVLGSSAGAGWSAGDVIRLEAKGTELTAYRNGAIDTSVGTGGTGIVTDATYSSGYFGVEGNTFNGSVSLDNWSGGNLCDAPPVILGDWEAEVIGTDGYDSRLRWGHQVVYDPYADISWLTYCGTDSDPMIAGIDHSEGLHSVITAQAIYNQAAGSGYQYATIGILPNRKVVGVFGAPFDTKVRFGIMDDPADNTAWTTTELSLTGATKEYPIIKVARNGDIYVFFRAAILLGNGAERPWYYIKSTDGGSTWGAQTLTIDLAGQTEDMTELYYSHLITKPYVNGEAERWYFIFTKAGGYVHTGVHDGGMGTNIAQDLDNNFGAVNSHAGQECRNITSGNHSTIASNTDTTLTCGSAIFNTGDSFGIIQHDQQHADLHCLYFRPDTEHWYRPDGTDLGTSVTLAEMDNANCKFYSSARPVTTKDTGYYPIVAPDNTGKILAGEYNRLYLYSGGAWAAITPVGLDITSLQYICWVDGYWYAFGDKNEVYRSSDGTNYTEVDTYTRASSHLYAVNTIHGEEPVHGMARAVEQEYNAANDATIWAISSGMGTAATLIAKTEEPNTSTSSAVEIRVFVTDDICGSRSRVRTATNAITLSIISGGGTIDAPNPTNAVNGMATFTYNTPVGAGEAVLEATAAGLDSCRIHIWFT